MSYDVIRIARMQGCLSRLLVSTVMMPFCDTFGIQSVRIGDF
jgi:hypothetical protein